MTKKVIGAILLLFTWLLFCFTILTLAPRVSNRIEWDEYDPSDLH